LSPVPVAAKETPPSDVAGPPSRTAPESASPGRDPWWQRQVRACAGTSHFAEINGSRLHYLRWSEGRGPPLVFVHGFRGHAHWWDWIAPSFAHDYDVVALDLSGMGDSSWRAQYDRPLFAQDILGLIDHLGDPALVVGHSFGGTSLIHACAVDSETSSQPRIDHAIVIDSWIRFPDDPVYKPGQLRPGQTYGDFESARSRFRLVPAQAVAEPSMMDHLARHSLCEVDGRWHWKFDPAMREFSPINNGPELLQRVRTPLDIVYGGTSSIVNRERAKRCVDRLAHGRGPFEIPDGGHHMMFDQPEALVATIDVLLRTR
jgi:pimeloyl-ACP methyl ester carboxylesterase